MMKLAKCVKMKLKNQENTHKKTQNTLFGTAVVCPVMPCRAVKRLPVHRYSVISTFSGLLELLCHRKILLNQY